MGLSIRSPLTALALVVCAALASAPTFAQGGGEATDETILELMKVSKMDNIMRKVTVEVKKQLVTAIRRKSPKISEHDLTEAADAFEGVFSGYVGRLMPQALEIYRTTLSDAEVRALIDFYKTPAGQSIVDKLPGLTTRIAQISAALAQDLARDAARAMILRLRRKGYDL